METGTKYFLFVVLTILIVLGLIGNCLSVLTWSRGSHRQTSTAVLLTALAVGDTLVLAMPAIEFWSWHMHLPRIRNESVFLCKVLTFFSYFGPTISSWIVVLVTSERAVSMLLPVKVRFLCTKKTVRICLLVLFLLLIGVYTPFLVETTVISKTYNNISFSECTISSNSTFYQNYLNSWFWLDMCLLFLVPFIIILTGNALIIYKLCARKKILVKEGHFVRYRTRIANAFTIRAIAVSITFCVCTSPVGITEVYRGIDKTRKLNNLAYIIIHILLYANSCFNFLLYCVIGKGFRKDLRVVLKNLFTREKVGIDPCENSVNANHNSSTMQTLLNLARINRTER